MSSPKLPERIDVSGKVYIPERVLGSGAYAVVYGCREGVAIKVVAAAQKATVTAAEREGRLLSELSFHPHVVHQLAWQMRGGNSSSNVDGVGLVEIISVHELLGQSLFDIMAAIPNASSESDMRRHWLPEPALLTMCSHVASALAHLHKADICHRDVKVRHFELSSP